MKIRIQNQLFIYVPLLCALLDLNAKFKIIPIIY